MDGSLFSRAANIDGICEQKQLKLSTLSAAQRNIWPTGLK
jgi:hypothetical protein